MKKIQIIFSLLILLFFSCSKPSKISNTSWKSENVEKAKYLDSAFISLDFYSDSVVFNLSGYDPILPSELLGGIAGGKLHRYSWQYSVTNDEIVLDPGLLGFNIKLKKNNDTLFWPREGSYKDEYIKIFKIK